MTIWTIYNHGTGGSSLKPADRGEIINLFGNSDSREQYRGKIITEGVGSIGDPHKLALTFGREQDGGFTWRADQGRALAPNRTWQSMTGGGVRENVDSIVEFIRMLNLDGRKPEQINMIGWSRGAVTCIRIAWALYQSHDAHLREIPINIFAVDPVAGVGHDNEVDACTVTPNVRNYFATLAMGETRGFFKPIAGSRLVVQDPNATCAWVLPMPGHHSDTAKLNNHVGRLVFNLAYRFLARGGTPVPAMYHCKLNDDEAWKLYEDLILRNSAVHRTPWWKQTLMGGSPYRRRGEGRAHDMDETFFPNLHARILMGRVFPRTYYAYFAASNVQQRGTVEWARKYLAKVVEEQRLGGMAPAMNALLESLSPTHAGHVAPAAQVWHMLDRMQLVG